MLSIKLSSNPHEEQGRILYEKPNFKFENGVTILVGRNGAGKSTLLSNITCKRYLVISVISKSKKILTSAVESFS